MHEGSITIRLPADVKEIERLNRLIRQFGELHEIPSRTLYSVNLALDEAVTNSILYGFEDASGQTVEVQMKTVGDGIVAEIYDDGREFNPLNAPLPDLSAPLEDRILGGLGIHLLRSLMDKVEYRREGSKNVLTLRKRIR